MNKSEFLDAMRSARAEWEALLAEIGEARMTAPSLPNGWSVKDLIAHITWHEREAAGIIEQRALAGSDWWNLSTDDRNVLIYAENQDRPLDEVLAEAKPAYENFKTAAETLSDQDLVDSSQFRDMPPDWQPWQVLADNSFEHYHQHIPDLREWLENLD